MVDIVVSTIWRNVVAAVSNVTGVAANIKGARKHQTSCRLAAGKTP